MGRIIVFSTTGCQHCRVVKGLLAEAGCTPDEVNLSKPENEDRLKELQELTGGQMGVPQVFFNDKHVGGAVQIKSWAASGELKDLVARALADPTPSAPRVRTSSEYLAAQSNEGDEAVPDAAKSVTAPPSDSEIRYKQLLAVVDAARGASIGSGSAAAPSTPAASVPPLRIGRRRRWLTAYDNCFTGHELLAWLQQYAGVVLAQHGSTSAAPAAAPAAPAAAESGSREAALALAQELQSLGLLSHVLLRERIADSSSLFRFQQDEESTAAAAAASGSSGHPSGLALLNLHTVCKPCASLSNLSAVSVASGLRQRLLALQEAFLSADGKHVRYGAMRQSPLFTEYTQAAAQLQLVDITTALAGDDPARLRERVAFLLNVYNALVIHAALVLPAPATHLQRSRHFGATAYRIGPYAYSLDDIEHGLLRGNVKAPYALRQRIGPRDPRLPLVCGALDPRIHFALNCGAKSCPPVRVYNSANLDTALDAAARTFLSDDANFKVAVTWQPGRPQDAAAPADAAAAVAAAASVQFTLSRILYWYGADFCPGRVADPAGVLRWCAAHLPADKRVWVDAAMGLTAAGGGGTSSSSTSSSSSSSKLPYTVGYAAYDWQLNGDLH